MSIDEHYQKSETKVLEEQEKKDKNSTMLTKEHFDETVKRLKMLENVGEQISFWFQSHEEICSSRVQVNGDIIEKLVKPGTQIKHFARNQSISTLTCLNEVIFNNNGFIVRKYQNANWNVRNFR